MDTVGAALELFFELFASGAAAIFAALAVVALWHFIGKRNVRH